ncbi:MAG: hypothetical protein M1365_08605 [Actinobacteria bacterium]|nr:hypothetical protein [Actinomycetota bacterium]
MFLDFQKYGWWILSWVKTSLIVACVIIGLNFYWILVLFKVPLSSSVYANLTQTSFVSFISLGHALMMLSPHWFKNVFGQITNLRFEFIFLPALVFMAPILKFKNKHVGFWILIAVFSIFLTKGSSEPFSKFYPWLYSHLPGFSLFRDSSKFFFLVSLSYAMLIGVTTDEILKRINIFPKIKFVFLFILIGYLIFLINPVWLNKMTGTFSPPPLQKEYSKLNNIIVNDQRSGNIFWIPTISPLTNLDSSHPSLEASRLAQKRPFASAIVGSYEIFNYLREAPYMNQLFDVTGIGYIAYPPLDSRRNIKVDDVKYYYTFLNQLSALPWLKRVNDSEIPLLKVNEHQDKFFITPNIWWIIGSDDIYKETTGSSKLSLSKNALIFAEESAGLGGRLEELPQAKIVLYKKTILDLAANFINQESLIFPAQKLGYKPDQNGWWKRETADLLNWRDFLSSKYQIDNKDFDLGGGWAIGEGRKQLTINNLQFTKGKVLLARVMESSRSGSLKFYQDNQIIGEVQTKVRDNTNVRWFEVGRIASPGELSVKTEGDINVINALAIISEAEWFQLREKVEKYREQGKITEFNEGNNNNLFASVTYQQINPTKYKVSIRGLAKPAFLIFSQNFDGLWKINNKAPLPVYSLLNGFLIKQDGEYVVEFEAQKYIYLGLIVTSMTVIIILLIFIKSSKSSGSKL